MIGRIIGALGIAVMILGVAWSAQRADPARELIASIQGRALYKTYCAACNGPEAKGDGPKLKVGAREQLLVRSPRSTPSMSRSWSRY